jgi:hypothetical protein
MESRGRALDLTRGKTKSSMESRVGHLNLPEDKIHMVGHGDCAAQLNPWSQQGCQTYNFLRAFGKMILGAVAKSNPNYEKDNFLGGEFYRGLLGPRFFVFEKFGNPAWSPSG